MSENTKLKIGFSLALLGVLFTLHPYIQNSKVIFEIFTLNISILSVYWFFVILLGLSVYCYGITLITEVTFFKRFLKVADLIYFFTILFPIAFTLFYIISLLGATFISMWNYNNKEIILAFFQGMIGALIGMLINILYHYLLKRKKQKDKSVNRI